jgi:hypothetical protein
MSNPGEIRPSVIRAAVAAVASGASELEKHVRFSPADGGVDAESSLEGGLDRRRWSARRARVISHAVRRASARRSSEAKGFRFRDSLSVMPSSGWRTGECGQRVFHPPGRRVIFLTLCHR